MTEGVAILVPVLGRPQNVKPLLDSIRATTPDPYRVLFICDPGDVAEQDAIAAEGEDMISPGGSYAAKINAGFHATTEPWVLLAADDLRFHPEWFERALRWATEDTGVIGTNDLCNPRVMTGQHATHSLVRRAYIDQESGVVDQSGKVLHEGYAHEYCNPPEAPIWMGDLTFRALGDVRVGDEVMGWSREPAGQFTLNRLRKAKVLTVKLRETPLVELTMASGRRLRCTPDHNWLNACWSPASAHGRQWVTPSAGRTLLHIVDQPSPVARELERTAGWLAGIYDGEGSWIQIAQCPDANPRVHDAIAQALDALEIPYTRGCGAANAFTLTGGRQGYLDFLLRVNPVKRDSIAARIVNGGRFGQRDRIVAVEPAGRGEVVSMTTSTGNYVAWGYASKNCDDEFVQTAMARGRYVHAFDSLVEHMHPLVGKADDDETYRRGRVHTRQSRRLFLARRRLWQQ